MFTTMVNRDKLLAILTTNRDAHHATYEKAFAKYYDFAMKEAQDQLVAFKEGKVQRLFIHVVAPEDHTDDYNAVIGLLTASEEQTVELNTDDYRQFCLDEWSWKRQWQTTNATYGIEG